MKTLREVAIEALDIIAAWEEAADMDAGFDAGEFSGPACGRAQERQVTALAEANGFTYDEVMSDVNVYCHEHEELERNEHPYSTYCDCMRCDAERINKADLASSVKYGF